MTITDAINTQVGETVEQLKANMGDEVGSPQLAAEAVFEFIALQVAFQLAIGFAGNVIYGKWKTRRLTRSEGRKTLEEVTTEWESADSVVPLPNDEIVANVRRALEEEGIAPSAAERIAADSIAGFRSKLTE